MLMLAMTAPILFASYSGLLGGAERVLLDCATRLERPTVVACPEGALAAAARAAGLSHVKIAGGTWRLRGTPPVADEHDDVVGALSTTATLQAAFAAGRHAVGLGRMTWGLGGLL